MDTYIAAFVVALIFSIILAVLICLPFLDDKFILPWFLGLMFFIFCILFVCIFCVMHNMQISDKYNECIDKGYTVYLDGRKVDEMELDFKPEKYKVSFQDSDKEIRLRESDTIISLLMACISSSQDYFYFAINVSCGLFIIVFCIMYYGYKTDKQSKKEEIINKYNECVYKGYTAYLNGQEINEMKFDFEPEEYDVEFQDSDKKIILQKRNKSRKDNGGK